MSKIMISVLSKDEQAKELKEVYFDPQTRTAFPAESDVDAFFWKYAGIYIQKYPDLVLLAEGPNILGYCLGAPVTKDEAFLSIQPQLSLFEDLLEEFPGHFHIILHPNFKGKKIGSNLLKTFEAQLKKLGVKGVHVIITPDSGNRGFYDKMGYTFEETRDFYGVNLLFLGKKL